jgi:hypothetical protein
MKIGIALACQAAALGCLVAARLPSFGVWALALGFHYCE